MSKDEYIPKHLHNPIAGTLLLDKVAQQLTATATVVNLLAQMQRGEYDGMLNHDELVKSVHYNMVQLESVLFMLPQEYLGTPEQCEEAREYMVCRASIRHEASETMNAANPLPLSPQQF